MLRSSYHRFSENQEINVLHELYLAILVILLLLPTLPSVAEAEDTKPVTAIYLYDESCHRCTEAMRLVRQAIEEARKGGIPVVYQEIRVNSQKGASYVDRYNLLDIPDLIIDNYTVIGPTNLEGQYGTVLRDIKDTIASSYGYAPKHFPAKTEV